MIIDSLNLEDGATIEADICVIGGGPAGITLAHELAGSSLTVAVLEGGGLTPSVESQAIYKGASVGQDCGALDAIRLRSLGGSSGHWAGYLRQLRDSDLDGWASIPGTAWPIEPAELRRYEERAKALMDVADQSLNGEDWASSFDLPFLPFDQSKLTHGVTLVRRVHFGQFAQANLKDVDNVSIYLNANLTNIETPENAASVSGLEVKTFSGKTFTATAKYYVLACGGIENPRLLLASSKVEPNGIGNDHDVVGRYFMEHPYSAGLLNIYSPQSAADRLENVYGTTHPTGHGFNIYPHIELADAAKEAHDAGGMLAKVHRQRRPQKGLDVIRDIRDWLVGDADDFDYQSLADALLHLDDISIRTRDRVAGLRSINGLRITSEQRPNPDSRVGVDRGELDVLGMPKIRVNWQLGDEDFESVRTGIRQFAAEIGRMGLGHVRSSALESRENWNETVHWAYHHMGTTRMGNDPKTSVVDKHLRVHNKSNLFVAGSSVFPSSGTATPTFTIIALAIRLADSLRDKLDGGD